MIDALAAGVCLARDLVNTPTNDMGPDELEERSARSPAHYKATVSVIAGDELLASNFPLIHAVGRASGQRAAADRHALGQAGAPKVTLVGKGVCFDTGGLDIKPASGMLLMKKDMGGAANVLGLALHDHGRRARQCGCGCWSRRSRTRSPAMPSARATSCRAARA